MTFINFVTTENNTKKICLSKLLSIDTKHNRDVRYSALETIKMNILKIVIIPVTQIKTYRYSPCVLCTLPYNNTPKNIYAEPVHNITMKIFKIRD